jgi:hypothetical protein
MKKKLLRQLVKERSTKMIETLASSDAAVKHLGKAVYTVDEVKTIDTQDQDLKSKATMLQMLGMDYQLLNLR